MTDEILDFVPLEELKNDLIKQDPTFAERYQAHKLQQQMIQELKSMRLAQRLSQLDIAERTGIKTQNISRLERGMVSPTFDTLARYAIAVGAKFKLEVAPSVM